MLGRSGPATPSSLWLKQDDLVGWQRTMKDTGRHGGASLASVTGLDEGAGKGRPLDPSSPESAPTRRWRQLSLPSRQRQITVLLVLLALLPALRAVPGLFGKPYAPGFRR